MQGPETDHSGGKIYVSRVDNGDGCYAMHVWRSAVLLRSSSMVRDLLQAGSAALDGGCYRSVPTDTNTSITVTCY